MTTTNEQIDYEKEAYELASNLSIEDMEAALDSFSDNQILAIWLRSFASKVRAERDREIAEVLKEEYSYDLMRIESESDMRIKAAYQERRLLVRSLAVKFSIPLGE